MLDVTFSSPPSGAVDGKVMVASNAANSPAMVNLTGAGVPVTSHSVALTWQADSSASAGYNVYRSMAASGPYAKVNYPSARATAYTDSSVQSGQSYYYVVTAVDLAGSESSPSAQVSVVIPAP
jgi:fibronectin type 3 domain-containing protein